MGEDGGSANVQKISFSWTFIKRAFAKLPQELFLEGVLLPGHLILLNLSS